MTKLRPALSTEEALDLVVATLRIEHAAAAIARQPHYIRALSDPAKPERLSIDDAITLDLAYVAAGHQGMPIYDSIGLRLRTAYAIDLHNAAVLNGHAVDVTREGAEAVIALLGASTSVLDKPALEKALKELVDSHRAVEAAIRTVRCMIAHGAPCGEDPTSP